MYIRVGWKSNNRENYPKTSKFFCMTQKPSAVCKKSYSQGKTLLRKLKFVIPFFKNNSTWKLWAKFINKDYPTSWVWQTLANTCNKLTLTFNIWAKSHILWKNAWFSRTTYGRVICILQIHYCFPSVPLSLIIHWEGANISKLKKCLSVPPLLSSNK